MIYLKTDEEIELMRAANQLVGKTLGELAKHIAPGVNTLQLDKIAEEFIRDNGAVPAFLGYGGFPNSICASVNEQVVHGIPSSKTILKEGDVISVDCGTVLNGFVGDSAYTFCVGEVDPKVKALLKTTKESLYLGIQHAIEGKRLGDIIHPSSVSPKRKCLSVSSLYPLSRKYFGGVTVNDLSSSNSGFLGLSPTTLAKLTISIASK